MNNKFIILQEINCRTARNGTWLISIFYAIFSCFLLTFSPFPFLYFSISFFHIFHANVYAKLFQCHSMHSNLWMAANKFPWLSTGQFIEISNENGKNSNKSNKFYCWIGLKVRQFVWKIDFKGILRKNMRQTPTKTIKSTQPTTFQKNQKTFQAFL